MGLSDADKTAVTDQLRTYFETELSVELGRFEADFLLEFLAEKLGPYFYNEGLSDAQAVLAAKMDEIDNAILEIEKPTR